MAAAPGNHTAREIAKSASIHARTPAVTATYNRLGQLLAASQTGGAAAPDADYTFGYHPDTLRFASESITIDPDGRDPLPSLTRIIDRSTDTLGRQSGIAVAAVGASEPEHFTNYGYDTSGRLSTVTSPAGSFSYAYTPGPSLISTVTGPVHTVTNTWEPNRDVLDVKDNRIPSTTTPISRFDYGVKNIGQRTQVQTTGSAFPSQPADWAWGYDPLGCLQEIDFTTRSQARPCPTPNRVHSRCGRSGS